MNKITVYQKTANGWVVIREREEAKKTWWNNGEEEVMSVSCPDIGWTRGRVKRRQIRSPMRFRCRICETEFLNRSERMRHLC
jgi:hypothetical protein